MNEDGVVEHPVFRARLHLLRQRAARGDGVVQGNDVVEVAGRRADRLPGLSSVGRWSLPVRLKFASGASTAVTTHWKEWNRFMDLEAACAGVLAHFLVNARKAGFERH